MKYKTINGWTKEKMLEVVKARPFEERAVFSFLGEDGIVHTICEYLSKNGNKCAAGLFIPDGHPSQMINDTIGHKLYKHPDLKTVMPLDTAGMQAFQDVHDGAITVSAKSLMIKWVEEMVE